MRTSLILILVIAIGAAVYTGMRENEPSTTVNDRCILTISGARYDVTDYLRDHPGGSSRIIPFCGKDATTAFQTQGGEGSHSGIAKETLEKYRLP